jgi:Glycosyltransferase
MRLLFFASDYSIGLGITMTEQLLSIIKSGIDCVCVAGHTEQESKLWEQLNAIEFAKYKIEGLDEHQKIARLTNQLVKIIDKEQITIVHIQNNWQLALISFVKYIKGRSHLKIIYTIHGYRHNYEFKSHIARFAIGTSLFLFTDKVIVLSNHVKSRFAILSYKICPLYLGVPDSFYQKQVNDIEINAIKMIFPGQFREGKNQDVLIRSIASYIERTGDKSIRLTLPGSGTLKEYCQKLTESLGVKEQIIFPGLVRKEALVGMYEDCNIGVVSSNSETFGQCIVEPFVLGKCIITRKVGIAEEIIEDGKNGFFYDTEEDLVNVLLKLRQNLDMIKTCGNENFKNRNLFNWSFINKKYSHLLLSLIKP